jgi:maltose O-acetyltransferase
MGDRVSMNANVYLNACTGGTIQIGSDVMIGPNVVMRTSDHRFDAIDRPIREQGHVSGMITIEDDVWIAANVTIVGGVRIGRGSVVAAGAVVVRDVDAYTLVAGAPAKLIRRRTSADARPNMSRS